MMNNIDWSFLLAAAGLLFTVILLFISKNIFFSFKNKDNIRRFIPIVAVVFLISMVISINYYYTQKLETEKKFYESLLHKLNIENLNVTNKDKKYAIDSLENYEKQLNKLIVNIEKQEKITGQNSEILRLAREKVLKTRNLIKRIEKYNEVLSNKEIVLKKRKGYLTNGTKPEFEFYCPTDTKSEYVDLALEFNENNSPSLSEIAYIMIEVSEIKDKDSYNYVMEELYKPQTGVNAFRIKNYLKKPNMILSIGYILKSEQSKEFPLFEQVSCYSYK